MCTFTGSREENSRRGGRLPHDDGLFFGIRIYTYLIMEIVYYSYGCPVKANFYGGDQDGYTINGRVGSHHNGFRTDGGM